MKGSIRQVLSVVLVTLIMLVVVTPTFAQEGNAANQPPAGVGVLILLMGLGAIGLVGFAYLAQSRADREGDIESDEE
jgi:hypothetical protein